MQQSVKQYLLVSLGYWTFTLSDGALRMLVVLYFYQLGFSPLDVAMLFLLYEFFGVVTNLFGGMIAARLGLNFTLQMGLGLQIVALGLLAVEPNILSVPYVMFAQALSGIAKDLSKMSAKSSIKLLVPAEQTVHLYRWVAILTGSKNALKGVGFFLGGLLLTLVGFRSTLVIMAACIGLVLLACMLLLRQSLGKTQYKPKFHELFSKSASINLLSAARFFLFGARDIWFVVALPVYLYSEKQWSNEAIGTLLAAWVIGYGIIQSSAPAITGMKSKHPPGSHAVMLWGLVLFAVILSLAAAFVLFPEFARQNDYLIVAGLLLFGAVFAINSAIHSYLIVEYAREDGVSLDVGFYYMANAAGRLAGTILSGVIFQFYGLGTCLLFSSGFVMLSCVLARQLHALHAQQAG